MRIYKAKISWTAHNLTTLPCSAGAVHAIPERPDSWLGGAAAQSRPGNKSAYYWFHEHLK